MELQWPAIHSEVFQTSGGVAYLKRPGVVLVAQPSVNLTNLQGFLDGFDSELGFHEYLADPVQLAPADQLIKVVGQLCYMSFGPKRSWNRDAKKYEGNVKESRHGSLFEHAYFTFLFYGIGRDVTHELVRHRAGFGFSQVSQRYVSGKVLRFVQGPECQDDPVLQADFIEGIESAAARYERRVQRLMELQSAGELAILSAQAKTDLRKKVQQAARRCLPNEAEAPIFVTANIRGWRHFFEMRANDHADVTIRALAFRAFTVLAQVAPVAFDDYTVQNYPDGTQGVDTPFRKV